MNLIAFNIIIDDIVFPDGRSAMEVLGGGGPQAAFGMRLWAESVGLVAGVGRDLPPGVWRWLEASDIDSTGIRLGDLQTPRAWQLLEEDGRRSQLWRVPEPVALDQLRFAPELLPPAYHRARAFHFPVHPTLPQLSLAKQLRQSGALISLEPFKPADSLPTPEALWELLTAGDIFSPNLAEAQSLVGVGSPRGIVRRLVESGARIVALRMSDKGSLVMEGQTGQGAFIPAVPVTVVDPVGAGNAYCGGFLAGWLLTRDVVQAGLYGAVAASFLVEQIGLPAASPEVRVEANRRLQQLQSRIARTSI